MPTNNCKYMCGLFCSINFNRPVFTCHFIEIFTRYFSDFYTNDSVICIGNQFIGYVHIHIWYFQVSKPMLRAI